VPRYLIERAFPDFWAEAAGAETALRRREIAKHNADEGVTWLHSYVSEDGKRAFCIYEAPSPEALRRASARSGLSIERINEVQTLDPYTYVSSAY
jgi:Nickel responsive protein SCO4226-like